MNLKTQTKLHKFVAIAALLAASVTNLSAQKLIEFDPPGASTAAAQICMPYYCGTFSYANNDLGVIVGTYMDSNIVSHGFLRLPNGHFISFNAPGAGLGAGLFQGTVASAINNLGAVAGYVQDPNNVYHAFIRHPGGSFTSFDAPGAGSGANQGTLALKINLWGEVAGYYLDANNAFHGFVRSPNGKITSFDRPGALFIGPFSLDDDGEILGEFEDAQGIFHSFIREPEGKMTVFDAPGAGTVSNTGTLAGGINRQGEVAAYYEDSNNLSHGFIRSPSGHYTIFEAPGSATSGRMDSIVGTSTSGINSSGSVVGTDGDQNGVWHGFVRSPRGSFTVFNAPHAGAGVGQGTIAQTINTFGEVAGYYTDAQFLNHGFLWLPWGDR